MFPSHGNNPVLMGVVNLTPDSFRPCTRAQNAAQVRQRVQQLLDRGCRVIDFGAVSTRPGAPDVPLQEELSRLALIKESFPNGTSFEISIDTTRAEVVRRMYAEIGPFIVNDISAGEDDAQMLPTVAELGLEFVAMHKRGGPRSMDSLTDYPHGVVAAVAEYFEQFSLRAEREGISRWILDPGFGFAKTVAQNWELLEHLSEFRRFGVKVLAGVADKRFTLDPAFNGGDPLRAQKIAAQGCDILRIH